MKALILVLVLLGISQVYAQDNGRYPAYEDAEYRSEQMILELRIRELKRENKRLKDEIKEIKQDANPKIVTKN